jgi:amino acid adenylation domain-containing protein
VQRLHKDILQQAATTPEGVAIHFPFGKRSLTYGQLHTQAHEISLALQSLSLPQGSIIAIYLDKSPEAVAVILGVLMAELAYLPLDVDAPGSRNQFIIEHSQAQAILAGADADLPLPTVPPLVSTFGGLALYRSPSGASGLKLPEGLAYVLYTSGSTGIPKGVMVTHTAALAFVDWARDTFALRPGDTLTSIAPLHFDLSIFDIFAGLSAGCTLLLLTPSESKNPLLVSSYIAEYGVTTIYATPTLLQLMPRFGKAGRYDHSQLRQVLFAGEVFPIPALRALQEIWSAAKFYNLYGPTETNVCTWHPVPPTGTDDRQSPYPIGQPCHYDECAILKEDGSISSELTGSGELLVSGASVMAGYLGMPEQTRQAMVEHEGRVWYKTGDLVMVDPNGDLLYRGRRGRMVKRRGYRIELGEIETALHQHEAIVQAACLALEKEQSVSGIWVFYTAPDGPLPHTRLTEFLADRIPEYMLPDRFVHLPEIPQTSSQKTDYQALKQLL